ncbi:MAG: hypothetical protein MUP24_09145 [Gillisia sp.]|nr:hypothetical protein [Gillisia sp.]
MILKKYILLILVGFSIWSCSVNDEKTTGEIIGNWNWIGSSGGIAGTTETPESTGDERKLEISKDSIKGYLNGALNLKTKYTVETRKSLLFNEPRKMIISENGFKQIIDFDGDDLILIGDCNDCFTSGYKKE